MSSPYTIAHHCDFSPGSPPLCKQQGSGGDHKSSCMDLAQSGHPFGHFCSLPLPLAGNQPIVSGGVGSKNGPMCGSVGGGGGEARQSGGDYVWHVGGSHLSALSPNQAHKTDSRGCLPFEQQHPHYRAFHVKRPRTQRPLPRASTPLARR